MSGCIALLSLAFVCPARAADAKVEQALRDADAEWSRVAAAKDLDKTVSFYADWHSRFVERISRQLDGYQLENHSRGNGEVR